MGCSSCGGGSRQASDEESAVYVVTYPDGKSTEVTGLRAAKVQSVMVPGAVYRKR